MQAAFAFRVFRIHGGAEKCVSNHGQAGDRGANHGQHKFPVSEQSFQGTDSVVPNVGSEFVHEKLRAAPEQENLFAPREPPLLHILPKPRGIRVSTLAERAPDCATRNTTDADLDYVASHERPTPAGVPWQ